MPKRRGNGEGCISKRKGGGWCAVITVGHNPQTGKLKRRTIYGKTRQEVSEKMTAILNQMNCGTYIEPSKLSLSDWLTTWLQEYKKPELRTTTFSSYEANINLHINPEIGHIALKDLRPDHLQRLYTEKFNHGRLDGKGGLSARSVRYMHIILHEALDQAVKNQLVIRNVSEATTLPKKKKKEIRVLTREEQRHFVEAIQGDRISTALMLDMAVGLRQGELLGLRWDDCNLKEGVIRIRRALLRVKSYDKDNPSKTALIFTEPKTESSKRNIPLPPSILSDLKEHRKRQLGEKLLLGKCYQDDDLVFCTETGKPYDPRNFNERFKRLLRKAGIPDINFHALRHTAATRLLEANVNVKVVSEILGHSNISTTLDIYSHVLPELKKSSIDKIDDFFVIDKKDTKKEFPHKEGTL